jgi:hypothetical protein
VESLEEMRIVGKLRNAELPLVLSLISSPFRNSATRNLDYFSKSVLCTRVARPERQFHNPQSAISLQKLRNVECGFRNCGKFRGNADCREMRNAELPLVLSLISSPFRNSATRNLDYFSKSVLCTRVARPERQFRNPPFAISLSSPGASRQKRVESKNYKKYLYF